jgi:hypothetical protein
MDVLISAINTRTGLAGAVRRLDGGRHADDDATLIGRRPVSARSSRR